MENQSIDSCPLDISDEDILKAMKDMMGYLDITPGDVKEIYRFAYRHALDRLTHSVTAGDVMTRDVVFVKRDTPLEEVADMLNRQAISGVPVVDERKNVAGIISEKDFLFHMGDQNQKTFMGVVAQCLKDKGCVAVSIRRQKAEDIMTAPAITISENTPVADIADIFAEKNINRVPVTDSGNKLTGIVTRTDIVQSYCTRQI